MRASDQELIQAACDGDRQAAAELVEDLYRPVYAFLRRLSRNDADAADLTQKTFSRLWPALPRFAGRSSLSSWTHGIAYHVYQDHIRANTRLESRSDAWWEECQDPRLRPDEQVRETDLNAVLFAAVDRLTPDLRIAVHLHYFQGLTLDQTAEILSVSSGTVKNRLRQAVQLLKTRLTDEPDLAVQTPGRL
jgi:RNA polymerase sigma-70 factor, ECF subfamily